MTTWLPALLIVWVALCTVVIALDPMFNSNSPHTAGGDRLAGAVVGLVIGLITGAIGYTLVRLAAWGLALAGG